MPTTRRDAAGGPGAGSRPGETPRKAQAEKAGGAREGSGGGEASAAWLRTWAKGRQHSSGAEGRMETRSGTMAAVTGTNAGAGAGTAAEGSAVRMVHAVKECVSASHPAVEASA